MKSPAGLRHLKPFWAASLAVAALSVPAGPISGAQTREPQPRKPAEAIALGEARWREGNFQSALDWISDALELARRAGSIRDECRCLTRLGRLSWALGKPEDSRKYYEEALAEAGRGGPRESTRESRVGLKILEFYNSAKSERDAGRLAESVSRLEEAVRWSQRLGSPELEVKCLRQLSLSCLSRAPRERFLGLNQQALGIARRMNDRSEQAKCLLNLGSYDFSAEEYGRALNEYSEAADLSRAVGNRDDELACLKNIATILMELGFYERAVDYFPTVYSIDRFIRKRLCHP